MARRTKIEAAATREQLLDAAERVFRERGVAHTSLAEVAAAAGVTRGAVYWHFRDKADLFDAMCERVQLPMEAMLACAGEIRQKDPLGALRALAVNGLVRLATDARTQAVFDVIFHKCEFAAEFAVGRRPPPRHRQRLPRQRRAAAEAGGRARDSFRATPTRELAARCLNAYMVGVMHEWVQRSGGLRSRARRAGDDRFAARRARRAAAAARAARKPYARPRVAGRVARVKRRAATDCRATADACARRRA